MTFPGEVRDLLQAFAAQSALAIVNARLFGELDVKRAELEVASRHKSEFLASMSHELRTPLNAVIGFSEVLLDRLFGDINDRAGGVPQRHPRRSGRHLLELLNEILDLSKIEAGQMVLEPSVFSIRVGARVRRCRLLRERAAPHGITLDLVVATTSAVVEADELRFKQVVLNLVSNAVKFTPDGGRRRGGAPAGEALVVTVTDTGVGSSPRIGSGSSSPSSRVLVGLPSRRAPALGSPCRRASSSCSVAGCGWSQEVGHGSTFAFTVPLQPCVDHRPAARPSPGTRRTCSWSTTTTSRST